MTFARLGSFATAILVYGLGLTVLVSIRVADAVAIALIVCWRTVPYAVYAVIAVVLRARHGGLAVLPVGISGALLAASDAMANYVIFMAPESSTDAILGIVAPVAQIAILLPLGVVAGFVLNRVFRRT